MKVSYFELVKRAIRFHKHWAKMTPHNIPPRAHLTVPLTVNKTD